MKRKILTILLLLFFTNSCLSRVENKGYSFNLTDYKVKEGLSSKDEILKNMGSPTLISYLDDQLFWIYFEEEVRNLLFFKPKVLKRRIMVITFNEQNIAKNVNFYNLENENPIKFSDKKTKVEEVKKGFFADLFGNIGQVRPQ